MSTELYADGPEEKPAPKKEKTSPIKVGDVEEPTVLQRLQETISAEVERPVVLLEVPDRAGVMLRISPNISQNKMRNWRKQAGEETKSGLDPTKFACFVVGHTTVGVVMDGEEVHDEEGLPMNFASAAILKMTSANRPVPDAVRNFFGTDPHVEAAALAVLEAAGYSDTVDTVDPTTESSNY
jgi:hypothetical protein